MLDLHRRHAARGDTRPPRERAKSQVQPDVEPVQPDAQDGFVVVEVRDLDHAMRRQCLRQHRLRLRRGRVDIKLKAGTVVQSQLRGKFCRGGFVSQVAGSDADADWPLPPQHIRC